ncbi:hypothetical protein BJY52DRAFT_1124870, partial [Lactarius psammicola]
PPTVLTYCYNSKLVYVPPGESHEQAIDLAQGAFPELRDVDRSLIYFEVRVVLNNQAGLKTARIHPSAWSPVMATLAQYEILEIHVAYPPSTASSTSTPPVTQPPPYASETGSFTDTKGPPTSKISFRGSSAPSLQSRTCTLIARFFHQRSSRDRQSLHPDHSSST